MDKVSNTYESLMFTALRLFAEDGLDKVSLRKISQESGARNVSAAQYHFKNKQGLIIALLDMIADKVFKVADRTLLTLTELRSEVHTEDIVKAMLMPMYELKYEESWGGHAIRFLSRILEQNDIEILRVVDQQTRSQLELCVKLLQKILPDETEVVLKLKVLLMSSSIIQFVSSSSVLDKTPLGDLSSIPQKDFLEMQVNFLAAGLKR